MAELAFSMRQRAGTGRSLPWIIDKITWPNGARVAVNFTADFDAMLAALARDGSNPTKEEGKAIANYINVATGRGKVGKNGAVIVNVGRGSSIDTDALVSHLRAGEIAGAALDVFEREPVVEEGLLGLENVVLTPHLGSATRDTRVAMGMLCVEALRAVLLDGRRPANAVG